MIRILLLGVVLKRLVTGTIFIFMAIALDDSEIAGVKVALEKKTGKKPVLSEGVGTVNAGVARIMELQQQDYAYIRP